jgi:hypothetical protein
MIAMNDISRHFKSTDTTDRAGAPVFQVFSHYRGDYRGLYTAKISADIEAADGVPIAPRQKPTDFGRLDEMNSRTDCLACQAGVYDV